MNAFAVLILAVGISLDGFAAGIAYGLRKVRIPLTSVVIASLISGAAVLLSMEVGHILGHYLGGRLLPRLGAIIFMALGSWNIFKSKQQPPLPMDTLPLAEDLVFKLRLRPFGLVIQVLKEPTAADLDASGAIGYGEACLLGAALALDAMGVGLAAALVGFPLLGTCLSVTVVSFVALTLGVMVGGRWAYGGKSTALGRYMPGGVLILIGLWWLVAAGR